MATTSSRCGLDHRRRPDSVRGALRSRSRRRCVGRDPGRTHRWSHARGRCGLRRGLAVSRNDRSDRSTPRGARTHARCRRHPPVRRASLRLDDGRERRTEPTRIPRALEVTARVPREPRRDRFLNTIHQAVGPSGAALGSAAMERPERDIDGCADAHRRLATTVVGLSDSETRHPSLLPGWTRGHVLSHLARNAEAMVRRVEAAKHGEMIEQYSGGVAGRAAEIEAGADRRAKDLVADVVAWSDRLDACFISLDDDCWALPVRSIQGEVHPVARLPFRRWREVEVHLVDLGLGSEPDEWSEAFVDRVLPSLLAGVEHRTDRRALTAWLLGRGTPPDLEPWS